ncbi:MAG: spore coat protein [Firmicutes bacterium]|jgi:spore coat protein CotF|nr:spore coat protein [Bacillota bacterium]
MTQQLGEKEIAGDILSGFKLNASGYLHAVMEAQDPSIRQTFQDYQCQCLDSQDKIFRFMQEQGWYKVPMNQETIG